MVDSILPARAALRKEHGTFVSGAGGRRFFIRGSNLICWVVSTQELGRSCHWNMCPVQAKAVLGSLWRRILSMANVSTYCSLTPCGTVNGPVAHAAL